MKKILLAAGLGVSVLAFALTDSKTHATAPVGYLKFDTVPQDTTAPDTTSPAPSPDTTQFQLNK